MNIQDLQKRDLELVDDWFKNHKAFLEEVAFPGGSQIVKLLWRQPGTSINFIKYILHGSTLFVCGDLGEAVYDWPQAVDLGFLAGCDLDYFGGKCQASSQEPRGKTWSADKVRCWIEEQLGGWAIDNPILDFSGTHEKEITREPLSLEACAELMRQEDGVHLEDRIGHAQSWANFIYESDGLIVSDQKVKQTQTIGGRKKEVEDYQRVSFEPCDDARVGYTWDLRTRGHLIGLKRACAQLKAEGVLL
jgi:hypothetical protein